MHYRWFDEGERERDELTDKPLMRVPKEPPAQKKPRYFSRAMITGILLSVALFVYGQAKNDLPLVFMALAFIAGGSRSVINSVPGKFGQHLSNLLFGFSVALFFGAIAMAFF